MKLIGYVRVSTAKQAEEGLGAEVQERAIRTWSRTHGHRVARIEADLGLSGSLPVAHRPGLRAALGALEAREAHGLVLYRLDRLARSLTIQEAALGRAWQLGASVFATDVGEIPQDDPEDPMRTAMRQVIGVFAQLERGMIAARMRSGRRLKAERGGYAGGRPPFGWAARNGSLEPVVEEQRAIELARVLSAEGASLRSIGDALDQAGLSPRDASRWHPAQVARILRRAAAS